MTTTASAAPTRASASRAGTSGVNFVQILNSEFIKFRTLLSTKLMVAATFVAIVGVGALTAWIRSTVAKGFIDGTGGAGPRDPSALGGPLPHQTADQAVQSLKSTGLDLNNLPNAGIAIGLLVLGALAVLFIASEYGTGMIRSTMCAAPDRISAFAAKALVLAVVAYIVSFVGGLVTYLLAIPMFDPLGIHLEFSSEVWYSLLTGGLYVAGVTLIGLGLGTLLRNSAGGITIVVAMMFVLPIAGQFIPLIEGDFWKYLPQYFPSSAAERFLSFDHVDGVLDPGMGGLVFLGWVLLFLIPATIMIKKRDV